jgi:hypothetical protein
MGEEKAERGKAYFSRSLSKLERGSVLGLVLSAAINVSRTSTSSFASFRRHLLPSPPVHNKEKRKTISFYRVSWTESFTFY